MDALADLSLATLRMALAVLALAAAAHKLVDPARSRRATRSLLGLDGLPADLAWGAALATEAVGAVLVFTGAFAREGGLALALLWLCYAAGLARLALLRRAEDCGCGFGRRSPGHGFGLARNLLLSGSALLAAFAPRPTPDAQTLLAAVPAALVFFLLYLAADEIGSRPSLTRSRP